MASTEAFVDLGEDFDVRPEPPRVPWRWTVRRFRLPVLLCLLLFLCGASLAPPPAPLRLVAREPVSDDASAMIEGGNLYVLDLMHGIRAFNLADGRLRWSATTIELATETTMTYDAGQVIVSMDDTDATGEHTVAFDAATGRRVWTSDYGSAQLTAGGVLVQAKPRPPGFNYPGTPQSGSIRLIDPRTGTPVWTYDIDVNCSVEVTTAIVELCPNTSQLSVVSLTDGRPTAVRTVPLGDAAVNFLLPLQDQLDDPQLGVATDTVLVAHAAIPHPVLDAYALSDLHQLWSGDPIVADEAFEQCGTAVCLLNGAPDVTAFDLKTGRPVTVDPLTVEPPPIEPVLRLQPVGHSAMGVSMPVEMAPAGAGVALPDAAASESTILVQRAGGAPTPVEVVPDVGTESCAGVAGYLVCTTADHHLAVWKVRLFAQDRR